VANIPIFTRMKVFCITGNRGAGDAIDTFASQGIPFEFKTVSANYSKPARHGIKLAHAEAVSMMQMNGGGIICEDDVLFTSPDSLATFALCQKSAWELGFDILLGGVHHCKPLGIPIHGIQQITDISGMHLYSILNENVDVMKCPMSEHIDNWIGKTYKVAVCWPMIALQRAGYSEHHCRVVDYRTDFDRYPILL